MKLNDNPDYPAALIEADNLARIAREHFGEFVYLLDELWSTEALTDLDYRKRVLQTIKKNHEWRVLPQEIQDEISAIAVEP